MNTPYKAVLFDLFGTLVENMPAAAHVQMIDSMAAALGVAPADLERAWSATGRDRFYGNFRTVEANLARVGELLGVTFAPEAVRQAVATRLEAIRTALEPRPDAVATLTELRAAGLRIGMVTNCPFETELLWPENPLAPLVEAPGFSSALGRCKPDRLFFLDVCAMLGVAPDKCLFVGDGGSQELETAEDLGMRSVLIKAPGDDRHWMVHETWPGLRVSSLHEVVGLALPSRSPIIG